MLDFFSLSISHTAVSLLMSAFSMLQNVLVFHIANSMSSFYMFAISMSTFLTSAVSMSAFSPRIQFQYPHFPSTAILKRPRSLCSGFQCPQVRRAFFKDFPVGGGGFFEKGPFCEIIY